MGKGHMGIDLTQTSYSTIPSVDMGTGKCVFGPQRWDIGTISHRASHRNQYFTLNSKDFAKSVRYAINHYYFGFVCLCTETDGLR